MDRRKFESYLKEAVKAEITDIIFAVGQPPLWRFSDTLMSTMQDTLTATDTLVIARLLMEETIDDMDEVVSADLPYEIKGYGRFRASLYSQRGVYNIVVRIVPSKFRTFAELNLPKEVAELATLKRGLVLVTGATRCGKSTTISTIIQQINNTRLAHIITIEDPIEFTYPEGKCIISQRQIGEDAPDFSSALKQALRQSPDVIMVGEIRDEKTFDDVLKAAETGQLVISGIHTADPITTLDQIISYYPAEKQASICRRLANNLEAIVSQRLLKLKTSAQLIPVVELMRTSPLIKSAIMENDLSKVKESLKESKGGYYGMKKFDEQIVSLYKKGKIDIEVALANASSPAEIKTALRLDDLSV